MDKILIFLVVGCIFAIYTEALLFGSKFKDGCDPNPCKHGAECKLDPRNKNHSTCICKGDYAGPKCDDRPGCYKNPCKHDAKCVENKLDRRNYTCECKGDEYVGIHCDKKNACKGKKNPCENGGVCKTDHLTGKQICDCKPGFGPRDSCKNKICNVTEFSLKQKTKKSARLYIDKEIEDRVKSVDELAKLCKVHLHVLKSFVLHPDPTKSGAYDPRDKTNPNHYIGRALSVHIYDQKDNLLCNDVCLSKVPIPVAEAKCFIDGLYAIKWKWSILDSGCIHTDFHHQNTTQYNHHRQSIQNGCQGKKF